MNKSRSVPRRVSALFATGSILLASCGGDDDATATAETEATATTVSDAATAEGSGTGSNTAAWTADDDSTAGVPANVAAAKEIAERYEAIPTEIPINVPISGEIPNGKTVTFISDGTQQGADQFAVIEEAAGLLGWEANSILTDGTGQSVANAWAQILREKPDGVIYGGFPRSQFNRELLEAQTAGIRVVGKNVPDAVGDGLDWMFTNSFQQYAEPFAAWVVANSDGAPHAVYVNLPDFPILTTIVDPLKEAFAEMAPDGSLDVIDMPISAIGTNAPTIIVSYLRAHPDVKYVIFSYDGMSQGLPAALKAAGIDGITWLGEAPSTQNLQDITTGDQAASVAVDAIIQSYAMIDALARIFAGDPLPGEDGGPPAYDSPLWIITKDNVPPIDPKIDIVPNVKEQYAALWGVTV